MRKSLKDIKNMVSDKKYLGLPKELYKFNYYILDAGHCIMAIPDTLLLEAEKSGNYYMYECPVPVKYVLENGYRLHEDHVIVSVKYSLPFGLFGLDIADEFHEF